jgi:hypothetical protein
MTLSVGGTLGDVLHRVLDRSDLIGDAQARELPMAA